MHANATQTILFLFFQVMLMYVPGTSSLVRCLVQIGVTLVARNSIFRPHCRDPVAQAKYKLRPAKGAPVVFAQFTVT